MDEQSISNYLDQLWQNFLREDFAQAMTMLELADRVAGEDAITALFPGLLSAEAEPSDA